MAMRTWLLTVGAVLMIASGGCAVNPVTGKAQFNLFGSNTSDDVSLGRQWAPQIEQEFGGVYDDSVLVNYVNHVGQKAGRVSHAPGLDWHFKVLDDDTVNAFALPGGISILQQVC